MYKEIRSSGVEPFRGRNLPYSQVDEDYGINFGAGKQTFSNTMMSSSSTSISAAAVPVLFCRNLSTLARTGSCSITQRIGIHRGQAAAAFHSLHNVMTCRSGKYCVQNEFLNSCARKALRMTRIMASQEGVPQEILEDSKFVPINEDDPRFGPPAMLLLGFSDDDVATVSFLLCYLHCCIGSRPNQPPGFRFRNSENLS